MTSLQLVFFAWEYYYLNLDHKVYNMKITTSKNARTADSVYVAIAGEEVNRRSVLLSNIVLKGQENASIPPLQIHANRYVPFWRTVVQMKCCE